MLQKRADKFGKFFNGFSAVAESILLRGRHFGKGPDMSAGNEDRIVSEPLFSPRFQGYMTFCVPEKGMFGTFRQHQGDAADEPAGTPLGRYILKVLQQLPEVLRVIAAFRVWRVACGQDPRPAPQGIHLKA